jgi:hypothetical protein
MKPKRNKNGARNCGNSARAGRGLGFESCDCVLAALSHLSKAFPATVDGRPTSSLEIMAERILQVALANVEVIAPRIVSMINYCAAEGIDQNAYLESLIEVKFKKKLHIVKIRRAF